MWSIFPKASSALPSMRVGVAIAAGLWLQMSQIAASVLPSSSGNGVKGSDDSSSNMSGGEFIGAVVGSIVGICILVGGCWYCANRNMQPAHGDDYYPAP